jgi:hypothetical protein
MNAIEQKLKLTAYACDMDNKPKLIVVSALINYVWVQQMIVVITLVS